MRAAQPQLSWLEDPRVFAVNRLPAHSDHLFYENEETAARGDMTLRQSLNGRWKFAYAQCPGEREKDFYREEFPCGGWDEIEVPGHIQLAGYDRCQYINTMYPWDGHSQLRPPRVSWEYNPVGSYVKYFDLEKGLRGKRTFLSFQGVETAFYVWLNGHFVGYGEDGFTPSEFEVTDFVRERDNKLAVEVYKRSSASWLEDQDFWRFSGIFREVYLYGTPDVHVEDLFVKTALDSEYIDGVLSLEARLSASGSGCDAAAGSSWDAVLTDGEGLTVCRDAGKVSAGTFCLRMPVSQVKPWSAENPYLYHLKLRLYDQTGVLSEVVIQQVGFRQFELIDGVMCLNGRRLVFHGVNRHEFSPHTGRAIKEEEMLWDIRCLKQNNINAVRTSHYPNQSLWYRLCDQYGIYLIDEANLESHGSWQKMGACEPSWNVPGNLPQWKEAVEDRAKSMLERDKNHPSVLIWSCGNESYAGEDIAAMASYFRERDPGRVVHYEGVFWNRDYDGISDMESRMYAKPRDIRAYLEQHPAKPYISCEYMHAMGNSCGNLQEYTALEREYALYQGGFLWDYLDQALYRTDPESGKQALAYGGDFMDRPTDYSFCGNGLVFADRTPSPKMQEVKYLYQNLDLEPSAGRARIRNRQLFADTSEYSFCYRVQINGETVLEHWFEACVGPGETADMPMPLADSKAAGERGYLLLACLKRDTLWAEKGFEIAFGQTVEQRIPAACTPSPDGNMRVIHGDVNIGIHGKGFSVLFSKQEGGMVSLCYDGCEMVKGQPPMPAFWRATTDNDRGCKFSWENGHFMAADLYRAIASVEVVEEDQTVTVAYTYELPVKPKAICRVSYQIWADGAIAVHLVYQGQKGLGQLPIFGWRMTLPARFGRFRWYGKGPEENYSDRCEGARLGRFEYTVSGNLTPYLVPQECGLRTGVRFLAVEQESGPSLKISALGEPLQCSVLPYTALELENASHKEQLPPVSATVLTVCGFTRGVGGDDSWGAPVHSQYEVSAEETLEYRFLIQNGHIR